MKMPILAGLGLLMMASALPQARAATYGDGMPEAQKVRFCERVRDFAVQAFYDREKGRPMKVFVEDGSAGAHHQYRDQAHLRGTADRHPESGGNVGPGDLQRNDGQQGLSRIVAPAYSRFGASSVDCTDERNTDHQEAPP